MADQERRRATDYLAASVENLSRTLSSQMAELNKRVLTLSGKVSEKHGEYDTKLEILLGNGQPGIVKQLDDKLDFIKTQLDTTLAMQKQVRENIEEDIQQLKHESSQNTSFRKRLKGAWVVVGLEIGILGGFFAMASKAMEFISQYKEIKSIVQKEQHEKETPNTGIVIDRSHH